MAELDVRHLELVIGKREPSVFKDYIEGVANEGLLLYKSIIQYGKKSGESLYTHVLNGISVLEQLRQEIELGDVELRVLFAAYTVHDMNKLPQHAGVWSYSKLVRDEAVAQELDRLGMDHFFPEFGDFLADIVTLARAHSAHYHTDGELLLRSHNPYGLGRDRVNALKHLMRAADSVDLSQTLDERKHKSDFLFHLNSFSEVQYEFYTHRLCEDRALLSNVVHNSIVGHLRDEHGLIPLLFYPDGVAYLIRKGRDLELGDGDHARIGERVAAKISEMTQEKLRDFVESKPGGIKIMPKCLELGLAFGEIWRVVHGKVQTRNLRVDAIAQNARRRTERGFQKVSDAFPEAAEAVQAMLDSDKPLTAQAEATLRLGEASRAYYIFIKESFAEKFDDPWHHVYGLLELREERWTLYEYFDKLWDRAYVIAGDISISDDEMNRRFVEDGTRLLSEAGGQDPKVALFTEYVKGYAIFGTDQGREPWDDQHLSHYVANQHKQCVTCSSTFATSSWMSGDVRDDITVQAFSNRLRGGPGDPKKNVCALCRIQFLLEKLNYPPVRGERITYLHLFPYSFLTGPYIEGFRTGIQRLTRENLVERALFLRTEDAIRAIDAGKPLRLSFTALTRADNPHPYGLYLSRYSATVGNRIIFPLNPAGSTDSERFLFALWNAMLLQKHFGCKVLLSDSPIAPFDKEDFHDLYVASVPLACRGLIQLADYEAFEDGTARPGTLETLWQQVNSLFALTRLVRTAETKRNEQLDLVRAMGGKALHIYYTTEKLMEARVRGREEGGLLTWLSQQAFPHVQALTLHLGGERMAKLSQELQALAEIAWRGGLRGRSLRKNSLMMPFDEVLKKLANRSEAADIEVVRAATIQDIFEHLERIAQDYRPGRAKREATESFVNGFYNGVYRAVYGGKLQRLLADEKLLRSAYLFYVREQIPRKSK